MSELQTVKQALDSSGLKYVQVEDEFGLMFSGDHRDKMMVAVKATKDYMIAHSALPEFSGRDEEKVVHNYLKLTFDSDMYKLARRSGGDYAITAELPLGLATPSAVEAAIRGVVHLVDVPREDMLSFDRLKEANKALSLRTAMLLGDQAGAVRQELPSLLRDAGVSPSPLESGKAYSFKIHIGEIDIVTLALSQRGVATLLALFGDLKPEGNKLAFLRRMGDANLRMDVCKVALSPDDAVAFMYQIPVPNLASIRQGLDRLGIYIPLFAIYLKTGSTGDAPSPSGATKKKSGCTSVLLAGLALSALAVRLLS